MIDDPDIPAFMRRLANDNREQGMTSEHDARRVNERSGITVVPKPGGWKWNDPLRRCKQCGERVPTSQFDRHVRNHGETR